MIVAVADGGPIIHLGEIDALALLDAFEELLVPKTVHEELEAGGLPRGFEELGTTTVAAAEGERPTEPGLDDGETAALSVAADRDAVLLTDDLEARRAAEVAGVDVHGSIGVVALAFGRDAVSEDEAVSLMRSLQSETSLFVTDAVVERGVDALRDR